MTAGQCRPGMRMARQGNCTLEDYTTAMRFEAHTSELPTIDSAIFREEDAKIKRQLERNKFNPKALPCERGSASVRARCKACNLMTDSIWCSHCCCGCGLSPECPCPHAVAIIQERDKEEKKNALKRARRRKKKKGKTVVNFKPCKVCGREFIPSRANHLCCSPKCSNAHILLKKREEERYLTCVGCGTEFYNVKSTAKYCGLDCYWEHRRQNFHAKKKPNKSLPCDRCGTIYLQQAHNQRFCSARCRSANDYEKRKQ